MVKDPGQQVYDDDVTKSWRLEFRGRWVDYLGVSFGGEIAAWAAIANNEDLEQVANILYMLRFSERDSGTHPLVEQVDPDQ